VLPVPPPFGISYLVSSCVGATSRYGTTKQHAAYQLLLLLTHGVDTRVRVRVCLCRIPLPARDLRNIQLACYFYANRPGAPSGLSLRAMQPYRIQWNHVRLRITNSQVPPSMTLLALNTAVVGLCIDRARYVDGSTQQQPTTETQMPLFLTATPVCECVGLGIVRAIDIENQELYILAPLSPKALAPVNTILKVRLAFAATTRFESSINLIPDIVCVCACWV
jgi:hypothetical protein